MPPPLKLVSVSRAGLPRIKLPASAATKVVKLPVQESFAAKFSDAPLLSVLTFDAIRHQASAAGNAATRDGAWLRVGAHLDSPSLGRATFTGLVEIGASATPRGAGKRSWPELAIRGPASGGWQPHAMKLVPDGTVFKSLSQLLQAMRALEMLSSANIPVFLTGTHSSTEFVFTSVTANVNGSTIAR